MTAEMMVRLDGETEPLPLSDVEWAAFAPCGCAVGCMIVETTDAHAAALELWGSRDQAVRRMLDRKPCPHDRSAWIVAVPDGHRWAERDGSRRRHLVPNAELSVINEKRGTWVVPGRVAALCEATAPDRWRNAWETPDRHPTCRKCEAAARRIAEDGAT